MKKRKKGRILSRTNDQRRALLKALMVGLLNKYRIITTLAKAKELVVFSEKLVTVAKKAFSLNSNKEVVFEVNDKIIALRNLKKILPEKSLSKLFFLAEKSFQRQGGCFRVVKTGFRQSDKAEMAIVEWVDCDKFTSEFSETKKDKKDKKKDEQKVKEDGAK